VERIFDGLTGRINPSIKRNHLVPFFITDGGDGGISNKQSENGGDEQDEDGDVEEPPPRH